jgi:hypothetical protein
MLVQDQLTGALHEVPDVAGYAGYAGAPGYGYYAEPSELGYYGDQPETVMGEVYDGFGNPVGFLPFLAPLASALAPLAAKVLPAVGNLIPGLSKLPGVSQIMGGLLPGGAPAAPPAMAAIGAQLPMPSPFPSMFPRPMPQVPPGWMQPPPGYQHGSMHRRYMRCVSWPGPAGLVPTNAGVPGMPGVQPPATVVAAAQFPLRRRLHHRRR